MAVDISQETQAIRTAVFAKDVRDSIANGIDAVATDVNTYEENLSADNDQFKTDIGNRQTNLENTFNQEIANQTVANPSNTETVAARTDNVANVTYNTLGARLNAYSSQLADIAINALNPPIPLVSLVGGEDNQDKIASLCNFINTNGGGTLYIPKGIFYSNPFSIPAKVVIKGAGMGVTILKLNPNKNTDFIVFNHASYAGIVDCTIDGNQDNNTAGSGLYIYNDGTINNENSTHLKVEHINIVNCSEHGIKICSPHVWVFALRFIKIENCWGYGIYNTGTDNSFYMIDIFNCKMGAVCNGGANNRFIGGKWYANGDWQNHSNTSSLICAGTRNIYMGIELQDNYGDGITINGATYEQFIGILVDACGVTQQMTGTVSKTNNSNILTGFNTKFTSELQIGQSIMVSGGGTDDIVVIQSIESDTSLTATSNFTATASGLKFSFAKTGLLIKNSSNIKFNGSITNYVTTYKQWQGVQIDNVSYNCYLDINTDGDYIYNPININQNSYNIFINSNGWTNGIGNSFKSYIRASYSSGQSFSANTETVCTPQSYIINRMKYNPETGAFIVQNNGFYMVTFSCAYSTAGQVIGNLYSNSVNFKQLFKRTISANDKIDCVYYIHCNSNDQLSIKLNPSVSGNILSQWSEIKIEEV